MFGFDADTVHRIRACFAQFPQIHRVLLYGSRAMGTQRPGSDVDITLIGKSLSRKNTLLPLSDALDELLLPVTFDTSIFTQLENPELIRHILERGVCFYEVEVNYKERWDVKQLKELSSIMYGYTAKSASDKTGPKYLRITDIQNGSVNWDSVPHCDELNNEFMKYRLSKGDIVFARTGATTGKSFLISEAPEAVFASYLIRVKPVLNNIDPAYLYLYFQSHSYWDEIEKGTSGSAQGGFNARKLGGLHIPVPPLPEQEAIVAILDQAFAAIEQAKAMLERNIANAKELFQSKLNAIFSQKGEGWVESTLGDVIDVKHGFAFKSAFFSDSGEHVLLTPGNYYEEGGYRDRGAKQKYYNGEIPEGYVMEKGALLVAMTEQAAGLLGSPLLVPESGKFLHNQRLGLIQKTTNESLDNRFLFHAFNTKRFRQYVHATGTGVKVRHTSPTKIKEAKLSLTFDPRQQEAVIETLDALKSKTDVLTEAYRTKLSCLEDLKKSILKKAFSGYLTRSDSLLVG